MDKQSLAIIIQHGSQLVSSLLQTYGLRRPAVTTTQLPKTPSEPHSHLTTDEIVLYQKRELTKELILLQGHLEQGCKINDKACDCCEKHPLKIEGLSQETVGMSPDPVYRKLADWTRSIAPMTTEEASASGKYDDKYPRLAMKAREFRKAIMPDELIEQTKEVKDEEGHVGEEDQP